MVPNMPRTDAHSTDASAKTALTARQNRRAKQLLCLIWCLAICDLLLTIWAHHYTRFIEGNPVARMFLKDHRYGLLAIFKITLTLIGTTLFYRLRHHERARFALAGMSIFYLLLMVKWYQYATGAIVLVPAH